jgi:hypothetical protein
VLRRVALVTALAVGSSVLAAAGPGTSPALSSASTSAAPAAATVAPDESVLERPDSLSAMVTARATGERVEDVSQRTEYAQVFANPEGSWTSEAANEPVRVRDERGGWHPVDTALVERDGVLSPRTR